MSDDSGDGFIVLPDGSSRWGRFGAAGLLLCHTDESGSPRYFVARRSARSHGGGTWGIPGGARHRSEDPLAAAMREFREEIGYDLDPGTVAKTYEDDHGGWSYWTFLINVADRREGGEVLNWESDEARWVSPAELAELELFEAFRTTLYHLGVLPLPG